MMNKDVHPQVTIFTTPTCVYCKMAKEYFKDNSVSYSEKDVYHDEAARQEMFDKSGQMGVPVIKVELFEDAEKTKKKSEEYVVGFNRDLLESMLGLGGEVSKAA